MRVRKQQAVVIWKYYNICTPMAVSGMKTRVVKQLGMGICTYYNGHEPMAVDGMEIHMHMRLLEVMYI